MRLGAVYVVCMQRVYVCGLPGMSIFPKKQYLFRSRKSHTYIYDSGWVKGQSARSWHTWGWNVDKNQRTYYVHSPFVIFKIDNLYWYFRWYVVESVRMFEQWIIKIFLPKLKKPREAKAQQNDRGRQVIYHLSISFDCVFSTADDGVI